MKVLVTGGTGFIGRRLMAFLQRKVGAPSITCLVKPSSVPRESAAEAEYRGVGVTLIEADLTVSTLTAATPPDVDAVFHLAANIDTDTPESAHRVNDQGTESLLNWLGERLRNRRVVYTSSVAVIDRSGPAEGPITETSVPSPRTAYGVTKLRGEEILRRHAQRLGYTWTIARLPTVYGPGQKAGGMFDLLRSHGSRGTLIGRVNWPGRSSVIHVDDVARLLWDLASRPDMADQVYCVASDESLTVGEIAERIASAVGYRRRPLNAPPWVWKVARRVVWNPLLRALVPRSAAVAYWRFTLIVDDGFWFDTTKWRNVYRERIRPLQEGLADTFGEKH